MLKLNMAKKIVTKWRAREQDYFKLACSTFTFTIAGYCSYGIGNGNMPEPNDAVRLTEVIVFAATSVFGLYSLICTIRQGLEPDTFEDDASNWARDNGWTEPS